MADAFFLPFFIYFTRITKCLQFLSFSLKDWEIYYNLGKDIVGKKIALKMGSGRDFRSRGKG